MGWLLLVAVFRLVVSALLLGAGCCLLLVVGWLFLLWFLGACCYCLLAAGCFSVLGCCSLLVVEFVLFVRCSLLFVASCRLLVGS